MIGLIRVVRGVEVIHCEVLQYRSLTGASELFERRDDRWRDAFVAREAEVGIVHPLAAVVVRGAVPHVRFGERPVPIGNRTRGEIIEDLISPFAGDREYGRKEQSVCVVFAVLARRYWA